MNKKPKKYIPKNYNNPDYIFIKNFFKITCTSLCNKLDITRSNFMSGKGKEEDYKRVKALIESEVAKLYIINE